MKIKVYNMLDNSTYALPQEMIREFGIDGFVIRLSEKSLSPSLSEMKQLNSKLEVYWYRDWDWYWLCDDFSEISRQLKNKILSYKIQTDFTSLFD